MISLKKTFRIGKRLIKFDVYKQFDPNNHNANYKLDTLLAYNAPDAVLRAIAIYYPNDNAQQKMLFASKHKKVKIEC